MSAIQTSLKFIPFILAVLWNVGVSFSQDLRDGLTLQESIKLALENNSQILQAKENIYGSEAKVSESRSALFPQINVQASYSRLGPISSFSFSMAPGMPPIDMKFGIENSYNAGISLQHTLFNWGRAQTGVNMSEIGLKQSESNLSLMQHNIAYQVVQLFYGMLVAKEAIKVLDQNISALENRLTTTRKRFESGLVSKFDVLTMEVQIASVKSRKTETESNLRKLEILFNKITGRPLDLPVNIMGSLEYQSFTTNADSLIKVAFESRLELEQLKYQEDLALGQLSMTKTFNKPNLNLSINYGLRNGFFPNTNVLRGNWSASLVLAYPIFDGFRTSSQIDEAEVNLKIARMRYDDTKQSIAMEVKQAIVDLKMNEEKISIEKLKIKQAEEALKIAEERHIKGLLSTLDLLDSQTALETARLNYLQAAYNYTLSKYNLDKATGKTPY